MIKNLKFINTETVKLNSLSKTIIRYDTLSNKIEAIKNVSLGNILKNKKVLIIYPFPCKLYNYNFISKRKN
jgi:hypothetical protein